MIISRIIPVALRSSGALKKVGVQQSRLISTTAARQAWAYRNFTPAARKYEIWAECAGAFMWWWIFWHVLTDYHHIIGHYPYPDIEKWTDEELGIPPDNADDP